MSAFASVRRSGALMLAGALVLGSPALLQPLFAPSWGAGSGQTAILLALGLLGGASGAWAVRLPGWISAASLGLVLCSPWPGAAMVSNSVIPACALVLACGFLAGRWSASLLAVPGADRHRWYAWESAGGALAVLLLLSRGFPSFDLASLCRGAGLAALAGSALSASLPEGTTENVVRRVASPGLPVLALSCWSGFQFFHGQVAWAHHFAQVHPNSTTAFGLVSLSLLVGVPLGALASRRIPHPAAAALVALAGGLLLPLSQDLLVRDLGQGLARREFPWDLLATSVLVLAPTAAASSLLYPWLLRRLESPGAVPALVASNLAGGLLGACAAGWVSLPLEGLRAGLWLPSLGWVAVALLLAPPGWRRWAFAAGAIALSWAGWSLWEAPLAPRPDYEVLERAEGWNGRVEVVDRGGNQFLVYNGSYALGGTRSVESHRLQARLALALRPRARDAFVLGLGTGITAGALTPSTALRRVRVVELLPQVVRLAQGHFGDWDGTLFSDPRFSVEVGDARTALARDTGRYDLVLGDLFLPWLPGAELLACREHFESVRSHLRPGGLFVQWFPLYQLTEPVFRDVLATARSVFGEVHLFREGQDLDGPMVALVAPAPGSLLADPATDPQVFQLWTGSVGDMASLRGAPPTGFSDRLERGLSSGGLFPAQPSADLAISGARWASWVERSFREAPPERVLPAPAAREAQMGFLLLESGARRRNGESALADSLEAQARAAEGGRAR